MQKDLRTIQAELAKPFAPEDLEWRIQVTTKDKARGLAVPYITNRAIQDRLDDVVGPENWKNEYQPWHRVGAKDSQLCGISIYLEDRKEWVTKWDGAENSDVEPIKGGLSDAMKRAAVQWGIGRVLYKLSPVWVELEPRGKSYVIKDSERKKLAQTYLGVLSLLQLTAARPGGLESQLTPMNEPQANSAPQSGKVVPLRTNAAADSQPWEYMVAQKKEKRGASGQITAALELRDPAGKTYRVYAQGEHPDLQEGALLHHVKFTQYQRDTVVYYILSAYEVLPGGAQAA